MGEMAMPRVYQAGKGCPKGRVADSLDTGRGRLPHSELAVARTRGGGEDKGRWFALWVQPVIAETGGQGAGQRRRRDLA